MPSTGSAAADAVGHRVVHGGARFTAPVVIDDDVLAALDGLVELDPLHQPTALGLIRRLRGARPDVPHVACFDTAFHATIPPAAATYAVPAQWREWGVRRYGFHGLSHAWAAERAAALVGPAGRRAGRRDVPPRLGRVAGRRRRRSQRGHHDGLHAPRRDRHGQPARRPRPGHRPVAVSSATG